MFHSKVLRSRYTVTLFKWRKLKTFFKILYVAKSGRKRKEKRSNKTDYGEKGEMGKKGGKKKEKSRVGSAPGTTYWKGLELQTVTAGKFMVLKPMERETLTSQLR